MEEKGSRVTDKIGEGQGKEGEGAILANTGKGKECASTTADKQNKLLCSCMKSYTTTYIISHAHNTYSYLAMLDLFFFFFFEGYLLHTT